MDYVDGFLAAVPTADRERYREYAEKAAAVFRAHGALKVVECWGDDLPEGELNSMHSAVLREPHESVVLSWVIWPSKAVRDAAHEKVFSDPAMEALGYPPLDGKRMIFGGFETIVDA